MSNINVILEVSEKLILKAERKVNGLLSPDETLPQAIKDARSNSKNPKNSNFTDHCKTKGTGKKNKTYPMCIYVNAETFDEQAPAIGIGYQKKPVFDSENEDFFKVLAAFNDDGLPHGLAISYDENGTEIISGEIVYPVELDAQGYPVCWDFAPDKITIDELGNIISTQTFKNQWIAGSRHDPFPSTSDFKPRQWDLV